jgi:hypothetical protein
MLVHPPVLEPSYENHLLVSKIPQIVTLVVNSF